MSECKQFTNAMQGNASDFITYNYNKAF